MGNRYKALIKQELKTIGWIFVYFCVIFSLFIATINNILKTRYSYFLERSIKNMNTRTFNFVDSIKCDRALMIGVAIGLMILVILQFRDYKDGECGRFLRGLPIKSEKYFLIKVLCGMMTYTIPFLIMVVGTYWIKFMNQEWIASIYNMTGIKSIYELVDSNGYVAMILLIYYFIITAAYMFLLLMQYLVSWPKTSAIIGSIITVAPFFIVLCINRIILAYMNNMPSLEEGIFQMDEIIVIPWLYAEPNAWCNSGFGDCFRVSISYVEQIELKIIILVIVSAICFAAAYIKSKDYKVETLDILMPTKLTRIIFCTGVIICSSLIPPFIINKILYLDIELDFKFLVSSILCAVLSGVISYKISGLGNRKKGGVGYEEV